MRDRGGTRARELEHDGFELHEGDVLRPETLRGAGHGMDVAYYLIHSMGRGGPKNFAASERAAAIAFARMARAEGIERVIYLGGLGDRPQSQHLRSRHETALALREHGPALVARPLIEGLAVPTVVTDRSGMALFDIEPISFDQALRRAVAKDPELAPT